MAFETGAWFAGTNKEAIEPRVGSAGSWPAISKSDENFLRERIAENVAKSLILLDPSDEPRPFRYPMTSDDLSDNVRCSSSDGARMTGAKGWNLVYGLRTGFLSLEVVAGDFKGSDCVTENGSLGTIGTSQPRLREALQRQRVARVSRAQSIKARA